MLFLLGALTPLRTMVIEDASIPISDAIGEIFSAIGCGSIVPVKVTRLGELKEGTNRPRPILVTLNNVSERTEILEHAKRLKGADERFSKIYLKKDLHPDVRKEWKRLRDALRTEKAKAGNVSAKIFLDYNQGVLKRDDTVIDRYKSPFRPAQSTNLK